MSYKSDFYFLIWEWVKRKKAVLNNVEEKKIIELIKSKSLKKVHGLYVWLRFHITTKWC